MNKFFHYFFTSNSEGTSSFDFIYDEEIISLKEILMFELQQIAYYIQELDNLGVDVSEKKDKVVSFIVQIIERLYVKRGNFEYIILDLEKNNEKLENEYIALCQNKNITPKLLKDVFGLKLRKFSDIKIEERQDFLKRQIFGDAKHCFYEIIVILVKSSCILITELKEYGIEDISAKDDILDILSKCNFINESNDFWINNIDNFSKVNLRLNITLSNVLSKVYGHVGLRSVSTNVVKGKAILVTGHSYRDLERILDATKDFDINIYTHSDLLMAHAYEKFSMYHNLRGHYQRTYNNIQLDFASFPGPILVTSHSIPHTEIIRGQIYTVDNFAVCGFAKIENDDFSPIIKYAQNSSGFIQDSLESRLSVGYNLENLFEQIQGLIKKIKNGKIKHLVILGCLDRLQGEDKYFQNFMDKSPKDCFVLSFSYNYNKENFIHINSYFDFQLLFGILEELNSKYKLKNLPISVFITRYNSKDVSNIFNLRALGIKNIYLPSCYQNVLNSNIVSGLVGYFGIKIISESPEKDIEEIMKKY